MNTQVVQNQKLSPDASYRDQYDDYPIAQLAIAAIAKQDRIDAVAADALYSIAAATRDPKVRFSIFEQLVRLADVEYQERLFDVAVAPGNAPVRRAAANALVTQSQHVARDLLEKVTPDVIRTRLHGVAAWLLLLVALCSDTERLLHISAELATHSHRRVFLLLMIWVLVERDAALAQRVAGLLPAKHAGVLWALSGGKGELGKSVLDDLGDAVSVAQVLKIMGPMQS